MGRHRRPYLPGAIFHITPLTIGRKHLFTPQLRSYALDTVADVVPRSGVRLLAVAVMSSHLHLVVQQGEQGLSDLMQPLLRRLALRLQVAHRLSGPIFWRPYFCVPCLDPWYARNVIVYTHLNPVRARISRETGRYPWTSHALYSRGRPVGRSSQLYRLRNVIDPSIGIRLFATGVDRSAKQLRKDYRSFIKWRLRMDAAGADMDPGAAECRLPSRVRAPWEDGRWATWLSPLFHSPSSTSHPGHGDASDSPPPSPAPDMATLARAVLACEAPGTTLDSIMGRSRAGDRCRLRHAVILRAHAAGYRQIQIARFLDVSPSTVSYVVRRAAARS